MLPYLQGKRTLDIGCGSNKAPGAIGIDIKEDSDADIVWDLNQFPWPLRDNSFARIICDHSLEHLDDLVRVIEEIHRVAEPLGLVEIKVPHFSSPNAFALTHKHFFTTQAFDYFLPRVAVKNRNYDIHSKAQFSLLERKIIFAKRTGIKKIVHFHYYIFPVFPLAKYFPSMYETYFAGMFPAHEIYFKLQVLK